MKKKIIGMVLIASITVSGAYGAGKSEGYSVSNEQRKIKRALLSLELPKDQQDRLYRAEKTLDNELDAISDDAKISSSTKLSTYFEPRAFNRNGFSNMIDDRQEKSKRAFLTYVDQLYVILGANQLAEFRKALRSQE